MPDEKNQPLPQVRVPLVTTKEQYGKVNAGQAGTETSKNVNKANEAVARLKGKENA